MQLLLRTQPASECDLTGLVFPAGINCTVLGQKWTVCPHLLLHTRIPSGTNFCRSCACCHSLCEFIYAIKIPFNDTCKAVPKAHSLKCIHRSNSAVLTVLAVDKRKDLPCPHYLRKCICLVYFVIAVSCRCTVYTTNPLRKLCSSSVVFHCDVYPWHL